MKKIIFLFCCLSWGLALAGYDPARFLTFDELTLKKNENGSTIALDRYGFEYETLSCSQIDCSKLMSLSLTFQITGVPQSPLYPFIDPVSEQKFLVYRKTKSETPFLNKLSGENLAQYMMIQTIAEGFNLALEDHSAIKIQNNNVFLDWHKIGKGVSRFSLQDFTKTIPRDKYSLYYSSAAQIYSKLLRNKSNFIENLPYQNDDLIAVWQLSMKKILNAVKESESTVVLPSKKGVSNIYDEIWTTFFSDQKINSVQLSEIKKKKSSTFYVSENAIGNTKFLEKTIFTPQRTNKILIVAPSNDREALAIHRLANATGMTAYNTQRSSGEFLTQYEIDFILKQIKENNIEKLILVETRVSKEHFDLLKQAVSSVVDIDHHTYKDVDKWNPVSSIEQLHYALGIELENSKFLIGAKDRAGELGGLHYGDKSSLVQSNADINSIRETAWGKTYVTSETMGLHEYNKYLLDKNLNIKNIVAYNSQKGFLFIGSFDFIETMRKHFDPHFALLDNHFIGGDPAISMYMGVKDKDPAKLLMIQQSLLLKFPELATCGSYFTK